LIGSNKMSKDTLYELVLLFMTSFWGFILIYAGLIKIYEEFGTTVVIYGIALTGLIMFAWLRETY